MAALPRGRQGTRRVMDRRLTPRRRDVHQPGAPIMKRHTASGRAIGYVRVSTDQQRESGLGLEAQRAALEQSAERLRMQLDTVYIDAGLSGTLNVQQRPGLADALNALRRGDVLLVAKRDRIARDSF